MTAEPPQSPVTEAVRSLEVRWIFPASWRPPWPDGSGDSRQRWSPASPARTPAPFWLSATQSKDPKHPLTWRARQDSNPRPAA